MGRHPHGPGDRRVVGDVLEQDEAAFQDALQSGLLGTVNFMQCCHPSLRARGGSIVNLGSAAGYQGHAELAAYAQRLEEVYNAGV